MQRSAALERNALIDLNVLPAELRPHRYPRWYVLGMAAILAGCVLLVPLIAFQHSASQETGRLRDQLALITSQLEGVQMDIGQARALRAEIVQAELGLAALQSEREALLGGTRPLSEDLSLLYSAAPPGMRITSVTRSEGEVTAFGEAPNMESVISYARALNQGGSFLGVTIISLTAADGGEGAPALTFAIQMTR